MAQMMSTFQNDLNGKASTAYVQTYVDQAIARIDISSQVAQQIGFISVGSNSITIRNSSYGVGTSINMNPDSIAINGLFSFSVSASTINLNGQVYINGKIIS